MNIREHSPNTINNDMSSALIIHKIKKTQLLQSGDFRKSKQSASSKRTNIFIDM